MGKMNAPGSENKGWINFLANAGFHCMVLGMAGVLALILVGFLTCCLGLSKMFFYIALGAGLVLGIGWSVLCIRCNCSNFRTKKE